MSTLLYSQTIPSSNQVAVIKPSWWHAIKFVLPSGGYVTEIQMQLYHYIGGGADTLGDYDVDIVADDGAGKPDKDTVLTTRTFDGDTGDFAPPQSADANWYACPLLSIVFTTGVTCLAGVSYWVIVKAENVAGSQAIYIPRKTLVGDGLSTAATQNSGASWSLTTAKPAMSVYGGNPSGVPITARLYDKKQLVVAGGSEVWYESTPGTLAVVSGSENDVDTTALFEMCTAYQKVFIANGTNLKVADFSNVKLSTADIVGAGRIPVKGDFLTGSSSGAQMVVDFVTASTSAALIYGQRTTTNTFTSADTLTDADATVSIALDANEVAGPHWYDWTVFAALAATYGAMPNTATIICLYRGRVVLAGNSEFLFQWYMSRQNHPFDFNYATNDAQTAVAGSNADAGELGDIITALIPYKDDYLVFGCGSQIWFLAGDPAAGGSINELDLTTGIYGAQSWCFDNAGNLFFWGTNGIYRTTIPGVPENISRLSLPDLVKNEAVDSSTHRITMAYDPRRAGILITITKFSDNSHSNYFYDLATQGFFPESSADTGCAVYSQLFYQGDAPDYRRLLLGCADGYVRYQNEDAKSDVDKDDVAVAINAYCTWGPLKLSQDEDYYGVLKILEIITAGGASGGSQADSNNVSYNLFVADTAEELLEKLAANTDYRVTGTVVAPGRPKGSKIRKRFRGMYLGIRLWNSTAAETWSINKMVGTIKQGGKFR